MAILKQPVVSEGAFAAVVGDKLPPAGTFKGKVKDIRDEFGVRRCKYQSTEIEVVDMTTFLFELEDARGQKHLVATSRMLISGSPKSKLFGFLTTQLGHAPKYDWDYMELRGTPCLITIEHIQRRDGRGMFARITSSTPLPQGLNSAPQSSVVTGTATAGIAPTVDATAHVVVANMKLATAPVVVEQDDLRM